MTTDTALTRAIKQSNSIQDEHPYKVVGNPDSYSDYNQGWDDACDRMLEVLTELLPIEREQIEQAYDKGEVAGYREYATTAQDYFTTTFNQTT